MLLKETNAVYFDSHVKRVSAPKTLCIYVTLSAVSL